MAWADYMTTLNPRIWWRLGDAGTTAVDSGSDGNDGTATGSPAVTWGVTGLVDGDSDDAVTFANTDLTASYIHSSPMADETLTEMTLGAIVEFDDLRASWGYQSICGIIEAGNLLFDLEISGGPPDQTLFGYIKNTPGVEDPTPVSTGTRYLAIMTFDGTDLKLYVNGTLIATNSDPGQTIVIANAPRFRVGCDDGVGDGVAGTVDEVFWMDYAISAGDATALNALMNGENFVGLNDAVGITATLEAFPFQTLLYTVTKPDYCIDPSYSPDGETIVFAERLGSAYNLSTIDADGTNHAVVITGSNPLYEPSFSADGEFILYAERTVAPAGSHTYGDWAIKYRDTTIDETTTILSDSHANMHPVWLTATQVAFQRFEYGTDSTFRIVLYDIAGNEVADLGAGEYPRLLEV